jgi:hypothetical protein
MPKKHANHAAQQRSAMNGRKILLQDFDRLVDRLCRLGRGWIKFSNPGLQQNGVSDEYVLISDTSPLYEDIKCLLQTPKQHWSTSKARIRHLLKYNLRRRVDFFGSTDRRSLLNHLRTNQEKYQNDLWDFDIWRDLFVVTDLSEEIYSKCTSLVSTIDSREMDVEESAAETTVDESEQFVFSCESSKQHSADKYVEKKHNRGKSRRITWLNIPDPSATVEILSDRRRTIRKIDPNRPEAKILVEYLAPLLQKITELGDKATIQHLGILRTKDKAIRQQFHLDFSSNRSGENYFFIIPLERRASIYVDQTRKNGPQQQYHIDIPVGSIFVGSGSLPHAGSEKQGIRLHGYFSVEGGAVDADIVNFERDNTYPQTHPIISSLIKGCQE